MKTRIIQSRDGRTVTTSGTPWRIWLTSSRYPDVAVEAVFPSRDWWKAALVRLAGAACDELERL